jgi:hypothetical protein
MHHGMMALWIAILLARGRYRFCVGADARMKPRRRRVKGFTIRGQPSRTSWDPYLAGDRKPNPDDWARLKLAFAKGFGAA